MGYGAPMRWTALALWIGSLTIACGGSEANEEDETTEESSGDEVSDAPVPAMHTVDPPPDGVASVNPSATGCRSSSECAQGEICSGAEGCDQVWTCEPARACTRDLVTYCNCDGETVQGSGSCPPEPYAHRGPCE